MLDLFTRFVVVVCMCVTVACLVGRIVSAKVLDVRSSLLCVRCARRWGFNPNLLWTLEPTSCVQNIWKLKRSCGHFERFRFICLINGIVACRKILSVPVQGLLKTFPPPCEKLERGNQGADARTSS